MFSRRRRNRAPTVPEDAFPESFNTAFISILSITDRLIQAGPESRRCFLNSSRTKENDSKVTGDHFITTQTLQNNVRQVTWKLVSFQPGFLANILTRAWQGMAPASMVSTACRTHGHGASD